MAALLSLKLLLGSNDNDWELAKRVVCCACYTRQSLACSFRVSLIEVKYCGSVERNKTKEKDTACYVSIYMKEVYC